MKEQGFSPLFLVELFVMSHGTAPGSFENLLGIGRTRRCRVIRTRLSVLTVPILQS